MDVFQTESLQEKKTFDFSHQHYIKLLYLVQTFSYIQASIHPKNKILYKEHLKFTNINPSDIKSCHPGIQRLCFVVYFIAQSAILLYLKYRNQEKQRMSSQVADTSVANFIQKSFEILENKEYEAIIHWMANGREFAIKQIDQFQDHILPKYFRHRNINSFIRQLNMYGFHKSRKDPSKNIFSHPFFLRGQPHILHLVRRKIKNQDKTEQQNKTPILETPQLKIKNQNLEQNTIDIQSKKSLQTLSTLKDSTRIKTQKEVVTTKTQIVIAPTFSMISLGSFGLKFPTTDISPFKGMMQKSCIMDSNPELYLKMRDHNSIGHCDMIQNDDDNLSIDDQIQRQRRVFLNRRSGVTILQTSNLLQDLDFQ